MQCCFLTKCNLTTPKSCDLCLNYGMTFSVAYAGGQLFAFKVTLFPYFYKTYRTDYIYHVSNIAPTAGSLTMGPHPKGGLKVDTTRKNKTWDAQTHQV